jgi:hypothetical protein
MTFADLQKDDGVFVDANTLIYHFTNHLRYGSARVAEPVFLGTLHHPANPAFSGI